MHSLQQKNPYLNAMRTAVLVLFFGFQVSAQEYTFNKGVVMDSISVNDSINETFSLYLPLEFDGETPMPVIFIFDNQGRGIKTARLFKSVAEQQGYIIVSSNAVSSEVGLKENVISAARLIENVTSIIPVDFNQISLTGIGEGAMVATSLPILFKNIFGVMPVGAQNINAELLETKNPFIFVGVVGDESFNFYNMQGTAQTLGLFDFPNAVYVFNGAGEWPNTDIISSAVGALSLHAMEKKLRPKNKNLIAVLYERDLDRANKMISNQSYLEANRFLELLREKYDGFINNTELKDKQRHLQNTRNYREQQRQFEEVHEKEIQLIEDYIYFFDQDVATANFENLGWWDYQKIKLTKLTKSNTEAKKDMGHRLLNLLNLLSEEKVETIKKTDVSLEATLMAYMMQTIFDQHDFEAYKNVISLSAKDDDFSTALFYLEEMLKNGFNNTKALYNIEGTLGLKLTPEFNWLIEHYLGTAKYYNRIQD